jgi:hypothetical protein
MEKSIARLRVRSVCACFLSCLLVALSVHAAEPVLSPNAPHDKPATASDAEETEKTQAAMQPYVEQARKTYPAAKKRFLKGLPKGQTFFLVTRLHDDAGRVEQVFIAVSAIEHGTVRGIIFSPVQIVTGYEFKQSYSFPESEMVDWLISHPDGTEEGNVVGKFLDTYDGR